VLAVLSMIVRRLLTLIPLVLGVTLFVFIVMQFSPVNPALSVLGDQASASQIEAFREAHGLDRPLPVQYVMFLGDLIHGNLGMTFPPSEPVSGKIASALPLTMQLTFLGVLGALVIGLFLGIVAALYRDRWPDHVMRVASMLGIAMPSFWLAILLVQQFAVATDLFPPSGYVNPADSFTGWLGTMALPAIALAVPVGCSLARIVRTSVVEELDKDYVRTAIGAGIPRHVVVGRNVLRNALITPITVLGLRVGYLIGGAVVIEIIFALPGMGTLILNGVTNNEPNLVQGVTLTVALAFVLINIVVDMLYVLVNPRIRTV
jgi:peptide/nickel transport system permease protein